MALPEQPFDGHPLVATSRLLDGSARPLPSERGARAPSGALGARSLATLVAATEALFSPDGAHPPPAARSAWLCDEFADFMARAGSFPRLQFRAALLWVSVFGALLVRRMPPLRRLPLPVRVRALARLESGPLAPPWLAIRALVCLIHYEHPEAAAEIGLPTRGPREGGA